mgnify:CR=1 FL=1|jgi:hypothetical protein
MMIVAKLKKIKHALMMPRGVDKSWDDKCDSSFLRFLDVVYYFSVFIFCMYGMITVFMVTKHLIA